MPQPIKQAVGDKIRSDSENSIGTGGQERAADFSPKSLPRGGERKAMPMGEATEGIFLAKSNPAIFLVLGLSVGLTNDFSDLALWNKTNLISQTLDIAAVFLLLFILAFAGRAMISAVVIILTAFILELLLVIGVVPWWTIGVVLWYAAARRSGN